MLISSRQILSAFFLLNLLLVFVVNYSSVVGIAEEWWSTGAYSHGYLGLAISLYAVWLKRHLFGTILFTPIALPLLAASCLLLLLSKLGSIGQMQHLSLFVVVVAIIATLYGFKAIKDLFLPLAMLLLTLPVWSVLQIPLREISTWVSYHIVPLLGTEITRDGFRLITPGGAFDVDPACSGLGFLLVSALFALCVAQFNQLHAKAGLKLFVIALVFAIVANWVRIIIIIVVGSHTQMQHFIVQDHLTFGWFVFAGCFIPLIFIARTYYQQPTVKGNKPDVTAISKASNWWYLGLAPAIVVVFSVTELWLSSRFDPQYQFDLPRVPGYALISENKPVSPNWQPVSMGVSTEHFSYFAKDQLAIQVYLANYVQQRQGQEMIFVNNSLFNKYRWSIIERQVLALENSLRLNRINIIKLGRGANRSRLIAYWYVIDGHYVSDRKLAKWHEIKAAITGHPGATLVAIAHDYDDENVIGAMQSITEFATAFIAQSTSSPKLL